LLARWSRLFSGPTAVQRFLSAERASMSRVEVDHVLALVEHYRTRLHDLSWFMRVFPLVAKLRLGNALPVKLQLLHRAPNMILAPVPSPRYSSSMPRRRSTRLVTQMDIHRLHRLAQIKRIKGLDGKSNHLSPSVKSVDKIIIEPAVAGCLRATTTLIQGGERPAREAPASPRCKRFERSHGLR